MRRAPVSHRDGDRSVGLDDWAGFVADQLCVTLLRAFGRDEEARDADRRALSLTQNVAERSLLERRIQAGFRPRDSRAVSGGGTPPTVAG